jgi:hypothetical protein
MQINFENLAEKDINQIIAAFQAIGWNKPRSLFETYL